MNKFKIIVTSYNNKDWAETNIESILEQKYTNYEVMYFDDFSTDNTYEIVQNLVGNDNRFKVIKNKSNLKKSKVFAEKVSNFIDDDDIVVFIDGDDWLATPDVLTNLNNFYEK